MYQTTTCVVIICMLSHLLLCLLIDLAFHRSHSHFNVNLHLISPSSRQFESTGNTGLLSSLLPLSSLLRTAPIWPQRLLMHEMELDWASCNLLDWWTGESWLTVHCFVVTYCLGPIDNADFLAMDLLDLWLEGTYNDAISLIRPKLSIPHSIVLAELLACTIHRRVIGSSSMRPFYFWLSLPQ